MIVVLLITDAILDILCCYDHYCDPCFIISGTIPLSAFLLVVMFFGFFFFLVGGSGAIAVNNVDVFIFPYTAEKSIIYIVL